MTRYRLACAWALSVIVGMALSACEKERQPGPAELALVTQALDHELNAPAEQLRGNLKRAASDGRIYAEELTITGPTATTPVDWWIWGKGLIKLGGTDSYARGYFVLTPQGEALVHGPEAHWLASTFQGAPQVVCSGNGGFESCRVRGSAKVKLSPEGAALFDSAAIPPQPFTADLQYGPSGWSVDELKITNGVETWGMVRTALFGDDDAIAKARYAWGAQMNRQVR